MTAIYMTRVVLTKDDPPVVFVTRDSDDETGMLSDVLDVWAARPVRTRAANGAGALWVQADPADQDAIVGRYSLDAVKKWIGAAAPATDRECVRVVVR